MFLDFGDDNQIVRPPKGSKDISLPFDQTSINSTFIMPEPTQADICTPKPVKPKQGNATRWDKNLIDAPKIIANAPSKLWFDPDKMMPNLLEIARPCKKIPMKYGALPILLVGYDLGLIPTPNCYTALAACLIWVRHYPHPMKNEDFVKNRIIEYATAMRKKQKELRYVNGKSGFRNIVNSQIKALCLDLEEMFQPYLNSKN